MARAHRLLLTGLACAGIAAIAVSPHAQTFTGAGPVQPLRLPGGEAPAKPVPAVRPAPAPASAPAPAPALAPAAAPSAPALKHLPSHPAGMRFAGEMAYRVWPFTLTEAEARLGTRFQIGFVAAASVLPEGSTLALAVNGRTLGEVRISAPNGISTTGFDIPPGLLVRGLNAVRVSVEQRHRVDCSVDATYELWTQLDPEATGLVLPPNAPGAATLSDLAAARVASSGAMPIRMVLGERRLSELGAGRAVAAAQAVALAGRFGQPLVDFGASSSGSEGLNVVVGPTSDLAGFDLPALGPALGPRLELLPRTAERRPTLVITGRDDSEVTAAIDALGATGREPPTSGTDEGLRALADLAGRRVEGGERLALRDLGLADSEGSGRLFRLGFDLLMPHDFLAADYAKVVLDLAGSYAAGLAPGTQVRIEVNGLNAASVDLGRSAGQVFGHKPIFFPLSRLRPGRNRISVAAAVPHAGDATCEEAGAPRARFHLLSSTELVIPTLARVARLPDLGHAAGAAFPFAGAGRRATLLVPSPDRETMGAAATVAARLAVAAGAPTPFDFRATPSKDPSATLAVGPARAIEPALWIAAGLEAATVKQAWQDRAESGAPLAGRRRVRDDPIAACASAPAPRPSAIAASALKVGAEPPRSRDLVVETRATGAGSRDWMDRATWAGALEGVWRALASRLPASFLPSQPITSVADLAGASLLVAEGAPESRPSEVTMLVSAPNSALLSQAVACLIEPRVWGGLSGRLSLIDASSGVVRSIAAEHATFVPTESLTVGNIRLIAAGWLSMNPNSYALGALLIATVLALATWWLVGHVGRRQA